MNKTHRIFFELQREPFLADIPHKDILVTASIKGVQERIRYAVELGAVALITGEIGSGKSTALRYVAGTLPPFGVPDHPCDRLGWLHPGALPPYSRRA